MLPPIGKVCWFCTASSGDPQDCVHWAEAALCEGFDSPSLRILAGLLPPLNVFEVRDYTVRAFRELGLAFPQGSAAVSAYARDLAQEILDRREMLRPNLEIIFTLCHKHGYQEDIYDFYLLHCACGDFDYGPDQYHWAGATRENIGGIVIERCRAFIQNFERNTEPAGGGNR